MGRGSWLWLVIVLSSAACGRLDFDGFTSVQLTSDESLGESHQWEVAARPEGGYVAAWVELSVDPAVGLLRYAEIDERGHVVTAPITLASFVDPVTEVDVQALETDTRRVFVLESKEHLHTVDVDGTGKLVDGPRRLMGKYFEGTVTSSETGGYWLAYVDDDGLAYLLPVDERGTAAEVSAPIDPAGGPQRGPVSATLGGGALLVAYEDARAGTPLVHTAAVSLGVPAPRGPVLDEGVAQSEPRIVAGGPAAWLIAWSESEDLGHAILALHEDSTPAWDAPLRSPENTALSQIPDFATSPTGHVATVWRSDAEGEPSIELSVADAHGEPRVELRVGDADPISDRPRVTRGQTGYGVLFRGASPDGPRGLVFSAIPD